MSDTEASDFLGDLDEALCGIFGGRGGQGKGKAECIAMAEANAFGAVIDAKVDRCHRVKV